MPRLWPILKREYLERVRNKWFLVATIFGPIIFGLMIFLPAYMASRGRSSADVSRVQVIDATGTDLGRRIASELAGGPMGDTTAANVVLVQPTEVMRAESIATRAVMSGQVRGYLVLRPGALQGRGIRYHGSNATALADMSRLSDVVRGEVLRHRLEAAGVSPLDASQLKQFRVDFRSERLTATGRAGSGRVNVLFAVTISLLLYTTIFIYGQNVLRGVLEEKTTRVAEVVVSSVPASSLLAGKVLGVGAVGLTQVAIWMASSYALMKLRAPVLRQFGVTAVPFQLPAITPTMVLLLLAFFVLGFILYSALFAAVGAMVSSETDAQQAQLPIVMLLVMSVVFMQSSITEPDGRLATNLSWIPFSAPIVMPLRLATVDVPMWDVFTALGLLAATCQLAVFAAARIYRTGLLMYGKRPSLREIARWVGQSR